MYSFFLSCFTVASTAVGIGWTLGPENGGFNDYPSFVTYVGHVWFGMVIGIIFQVGPYVRATATKMAQSPSDPPKEPT